MFFVGLKSHDCGSVDYTAGIVATCVLIRDVALAIGTGIIASAAYERLTAWTKDRRLRHQFSRLAGEYYEAERQLGGAASETGGTVKLTYKGGTQFRTEGIASSGALLWHGEIFMREEAGVLGAGYYSYIEGDDTGIHRVVYNPESKHFNVSGENTSHVEGKRDFKMLWKRKA